MTRRLRQEDGFVVVTAVIVLLIALLFTTALMARSLSTADAVRGDGQSKAALQAARAGVQLAQWQTAALAAKTLAGDPSTACVTDTGATIAPGAAEADGWCPVISRDLGAGESVRYRISTDRDGNPGDSRTTQDIVAIGTADGAHRRVRQQVEAYDVRGIFGDYTVVSDLDLDLASNVTVGTAQVNANIRSNGNIDLGSNVTVCGDAIPGPTGTVNFSANVTNCGGSTTPPDAKLDLPPADATEAQASNDDGGICGASCPSGVTFTGNALTLGKSTALTAQGNTFLLCSLTLLSNSHLTFQPTDPAQPVRVFIDAPSPSCGGTTTSMSLSSNTVISTTSTAFPLVQFLVVGADPATSVNIASNGAIPIELYAPQSIVSFSSNVSSIGGVVGKQVKFSSNIDLTPATSPGRLDFDVKPTVYPPQDFTECPSAADFPAGDPEAGC